MLLSIIHSSHGAKSRSSSGLISEYKHPGIHSNHLQILVEPSSVQSAAIYSWPSAYNTYGRFSLHNLLIEKAGLVGYDPNSWAIPGLVFLVFEWRSDKPSSSSAYLQVRKTWRLWSPKPFQFNDGYVQSSARVRPLDFTTSGSLPAEAAGERTRAASRVYSKQVGTLPSNSFPSQPPCPPPKVGKGTAGGWWGGKGLTWPGLLWADFCWLPLPPWLFAWTLDLSPLAPKQNKTFVGRRKKRPPLPSDTALWVLSLLSFAS